MTKAATEMQMPPPEREGNLLPIRFKFEEAAPLLFSMEFAKNSKEMVEQVIVMRPRKFHYRENV